MALPFFGGGGRKERINSLFCLVKFVLLSVMKLPSAFTNSFNSHYLLWILTTVEYGDGDLCV